MRIGEQIGGNHYQQFMIQPVEFAHVNCLSFIAGNIVKYICRWEVRNQIQDLDKIIHYATILKEYAEKEEGQLKEQAQLWSKDLKDEERDPPF